MPFYPSDPTSARANESTLFERMRQDTYREPDTGLSNEVASLSTTGPRDLVVVDITESKVGAVRFSRGEQEGKPAVIMQERDSEGTWHDTWSLPSDSIDAREGMIGWLNTQRHRWERFSRMLHRRGPDELTHWVFELMVVPNTPHATPPRFEPARWTTIQTYARISPTPGQQSMMLSHAHARPRQMDDCGCRAGSIQYTRDF